jgi:chromosome segregation ATPase
MAVRIKRSQINLFDPSDNLHFSIDQQATQTLFTFPSVLVFTDHQNRTVYDVLDYLQRIPLAEGDINSLESRASLAETDINALESRASVAEDDIDALESRASVAEDDIDVLESRASVMEDDLDALESRASVAESDIDALESRASVAEDDIDLLESRASSVEGEIEDIKSAIIAMVDGEFETNLNTLQAITNFFNSNTGTADLVALNNRLTEIEAVVSTLTT